MFLYYCKRKSQEPSEKFFESIIKKVGDSADWDMMLEMLELKQVYWLSFFPPPKVDEEKKAK